MDCDKQFLAAPVKSAVDKFGLIPEFLKVRGFVKQHLDSFNHFINMEMKKIVLANSEIRSTSDNIVYLRYKDVSIGEPSVMVDGVRQRLRPHTCRLLDITYAAPILVDIDYAVRRGQRSVMESKHGVTIGRMPIMLRRNRCVLYGKNEKGLARLREFPLDPGGYFVVKGTEKMILIQEQLSRNRIIIDTDKNGCVQASITSSTSTRMTVMKAMCMESDQEVVQMMGRDPRYSALLLPSIEECAKADVYTRQQALEYLEKQVKPFPYQTSQAEIRALGILRDIFLANIPVHQNNFRSKCIYVAVMLRRVMEAIFNKDAMDDKYYLGNKRLELSGQLLSLLFEDLFKTMNDEVSKAIDTKLKNSSLLDVYTLIVTNSITVGLERSLATGNWDVKRFRMHRKGMTQVVSRLSYIGTLGYMTKISPQFEKTRKVSGPRALHPSQWGMLCPCDTPDGEACGLVKHLALMTHVTTDEEEGPIMSLCYYLGVEDLEILSGEELHKPNSFLVMLNGLIIGKHRKPQHFANGLRKLRRSGRIGQFVSIFVNEKQRCIYIPSDGGRFCRPLVIADRGVSRIKEHHMKHLKDGVWSFDSFLQEGLIEYLDVNEENNALKLVNRV